MRWIHPSRGWLSSRLEKKFVAPTSRLDNVINLCKRRGFVFPSGEIYGGTRSAWDYGPLGVELKENIKKQWWRSVVTGREDIVGLDSSVILPRQVWVASGHVTAFHDPADRMPVVPPAVPRRPSRGGLRSAEGPHADGLDEITCPHCGTRGQWTEPRDFNMMLKTYLGAVEDESGLHYLRPETAQGIFVNFANVVQVDAQEAAVRHRPGRQVVPQRDHARKLHLPDPGVRADGDGVLRQAGHRRGVAPVLDRRAHSLVHRPRARRGTTCVIFEHPKEKLSHYSKRTVDIEYRFGFAGSDWGELEGIANRTDFDLSTHSEHSGVDLSYFDQATGERYIPYVIEPAAGLDPRR